jgi:hypothetical protein
MAHTIHHAKDRTSQGSDAYKKGFGALEGFGSKNRIRVASETFEKGGSVCANFSSGNQTDDPTSSHATPRDLFNKYDVDRSGAISIKEFRRLCYDMGYFLSDAELGMDVKMLDVDGDGEISYDECMYGYLFKPSRKVWS